MSDADAPFHALTSEADWNHALQRSDETPILIFKHSASCPVSGNAHEEMAALAEEGLLPTYKVVVQTDRAVSDQIESDLDVRHETPQAILLHERTPVFDTSHFNVTEETIREEVRRVPLSTG